jgi:GcrA cell cycle regulator
MSNKWSYEEDTTFKAMWLEGKSASQISRVLPGRTRNAVLGRVFRLGLPQRVSPIGAPRHQGAAPKPKVAVVKVAAPVAPDLKDPGPMSPPITTMDLRDHHCKWPYDARRGYHYCGQPAKDDRPFCQYHCDKAYQPKMTKAAS